MELISSLAPKAAPCGGGLRPQARCQGATTNKSNITGIALASVLVLVLLLVLALISSLAPKAAPCGRKLALRGRPSNVISQIDFSNTIFIIKALLLLLPTGFCGPGWLRNLSGPEGPGPGRPAGNRQGGVLVFQLIIHINSLCVRPAGNRQGGVFVFN